MKRTSRNLGIENRNPLNIRYSRANRWLGLHPGHPDVGGFCCFISPVYGYRAAFLLLRTYMQRYGLVTPRAIITRWAPPCENKTELYIACVCGRSGLEENQLLFPDGIDLCRLVAAMARQESGMHVTPGELMEIRRRFGV